MPTDSSPRFCLLAMLAVLTACGGRAELNDDDASSDGGASSGGSESTGGMTSSGGAPVTGGAASGGAASWMGCTEDSTDQIGLTLDSESIWTLYADARQERLVSLAEGATATLLVTGEFSAAAIEAPTNSGPTNQLILWRGGDEAASASIDSDEPLVARFLSDEGLFVAESPTTSYFLSVDASGSQPGNLHVLDVPDAEGIAPAKWREGDDAFVGFVHLESSSKELTFVLGEGEEPEYSHGVFLSFDQDSQIIARTRAGASTLALLEAAEGPSSVHVSDAWGIVTRSGIPILRVELEMLSATPLEPVGLDAPSEVSQVTSAGSYFLAHDGTDGWPLWRLDAASGALDVPQRDKIWDGEVWLLDSEECGRSTQVLADGRLGVFLRDNSRGYFFLEEEIGSSQYAHRGVAIESPAHLRVSWASNRIVLEHDGGEGSPCPLQEYSNADRSSLIPSTATMIPTGVQLLAPEGGGQFLSSGFEESAWGQTNFAYSSDGSCLALRENHGWTVWSRMPLAGTAPLVVDQVVLR